MKMAAYCRVSTEKEEQLLSLENQREFFYQYAKKSGDTLVKIYADEGISGKSMKKREAFMQLLKDSENGGFDYVAVKDISRFARNTSDFLYGIRTLRSNGVDVRFLSGNQTVIGESEFILTIFAALAQEESANLSKRVIFGKRQNAKKGRVPNMIYGYDKVDTYTLSVNEYESSIVRMIFRQYAGGMGTRRIADGLNSMKVPTKKNAQWLPRTVKRMLQNPVYTGRLINNKSTTKDFLTGSRKELPPEEWFIHERPEYRIISDELFFDVRDKIEQRRKKYENSGRYSGEHVFSNIIMCGECNKNFTAKTDGNGHVRYRCSMHNISSKRCINSTAADEKELLDAIKNYILSVIDLPDTQILKSAETNMQDKTLLKNRTMLKTRRNKLKELYIMDAIDKYELKKELNEIEEGLQRIEKELSACETEKITDVRKMISECGYNNEDMRNLVEKIVVNKEKTIDIFMK